MSTAKPEFGQNPSKSSKNLDFLSSLSPEYIEAMRAQHREDPSSVSDDLRFFFEVLELAEDMPSPVRSPVQDLGVANELRVSDLIEAYRMRGHLAAQTDPLGLHKSPINPHLELSYFQLDNVSARMKFSASQQIGLPPSTLPEIVQHLKLTYCQGIGVEYHYIRDEEVRAWLQKKIETNHNQTQFKPEEKLRILNYLFKATAFESFLQNNYTGQKRFSLEGAEALIPALRMAIEKCAELGAKEVVLGMAHRGRLNVLANIMEKPYAEIFREFEGAELPELVDAMGDVKYHQGYSNDIELPGGRSVHLSLAPNPSHLEFVNPVVEGITRAKQDFKHDGNRSRVVPFLIHGDAAVIGQGVVPETLNLAHVNGYRTGGTVHLVINNQIGFTTLPHAARSSLYCTDHGKATQCPIFHVNGDRVEDVIHAINLACEYRMTMKRDVFVDVICYRKYGHNEGDEPRFTQPLMYKKIEKHPSPFEIYAKQLSDEPQVDQAKIDEFQNSFKSTLDEKRAEVKAAPGKMKADMFGGLWRGYELSTEPKMLEPVFTGIKKESFDRIIDCMHHIPDHVKPLPKFQRMLNMRKKKIQEAGMIDWAVAEQLAFGSLIMEKYPVRLSGQDSIRGTFSQRHLAMRDIETGKRYYFLHQLDKDQAPLSAYDSPLSETAVMGFDYGYSMAVPQSLVMWEGQFGDFNNGAQVIIDQFIASGEAKWYRMSGLVLLLPHGYEGQGPEHSSARLERFLQLCGQNNMQVCYPSTPAQYFHLLRRQVIRKFRKPLIVMTPKSPLRMPEVVSERSEFEEGRFQNILITGARKSAEKVVLCSGKIYWDLQKEIKARQLEDKVLILRVEQLYPLDKQQILGIHDVTKDIPWIWCQEEPKNMGAWSFMRLNLLDLGIELKYAGRRAAASPATGSYLKHEREQRQVIEDCLSL